MGVNSTIIQAPGPAIPLTQFFNIGPNIWPIVMVDNQAALTPQIVNIVDLTVDGDSQQDTSMLPLLQRDNTVLMIGSLPSAIIMQEELFKMSIPRIQEAPRISANFQGVE